MNIENYFKSLTLELTGLKDRVRNFIENAHWQTDGEWKESVLRSFLNRNISQTLNVGRGFIISPSGPSTQIDVLIYKADSPVLFRDGDLVFVTPEAVRGVIEVKTIINSSIISSSLDKLTKIGDMLSADREKSLLGLFSYESEIQSNQTALDQLRKFCRSRKQVADILCLGESQFIKYWHHNPQGGNGLYEKWHSYRLEKMAYGYFIHNILIHLSTIIQESLWFPEHSKEISKDGEIFRSGAMMERFPID